jgi:hypothetical protein
MMVVVFSVSWSDHDTELVARKVTHPDHLLPLPQFGFFV